MQGAPEAVAPVYSPTAVAHTILRCATTPVREIAVGGAGRLGIALAHLAPPVADAAMSRTLFSQQMREKPHASRTLGSGQERGDYDGVVMQHSAYASLRTMPFALSALAAVGVSLLAFGIARSLTR